MTYEEKYLLEALEALVDSYELRQVLYMLAHVCNEKAGHISLNWQDNMGAKVWAERSNKIAALAVKF